MQDFEYYCIRDVVEKYSFKSSPGTRDFQNYVRWRNSLIIHYDKTSLYDMHV